MSENEPKKRGFFSRLFGLEEEQPKPAPESQVEPSPEPDAATEVPPEAEPEAPTAPDVLMGEAAPLPIAMPEVEPEPEPEAQPEPEPEPVFAAPVPPPPVPEPPAPEPLVEPPKHLGDEADLVGPLRPRHRAVHQAQARRHDPGGPGGRADPGRFRPGDRDAGIARPSARAATRRASRPTRSGRSWPRGRSGRWRRWRCR
jgi:hypothetical protein